MPDLQEVLLRDTRTFKDDAERLAAYKMQVLNDADDMSDQRDKANADLRFISTTGGQWEDFLGEEWDERTRLEFDTTSDYINTYLGEYAENRNDVEYKPNDHKTSDEDAELLNGIYRADYLDESGEVSMAQAIFEQVVCGYGCLHIGTKFADEEDPESDDMRVDFRPIFNAYNMVFWDNAALRPDKRDAKHCTMLYPYTRESYQQTFGEDEEPSSAFSPKNRRWADWSMKTKNVFYVATRYEIDKKRTLHHLYSNIRTNEIESYRDSDHDLIKDELGKSPWHKKIRTKIVMEQKVLKSVFNGQKFLQTPEQIPGKHIPIIPFYAYRTFVDGIERYHGLVRKLMDPQRLFNMQMSQLAENSASSGQEVPIFDPLQVPTNIANLWADRNNKPYMLAKSLIDPVTGEIKQHGPLGYLKPPQLDGSTAALLQIVPEYIKQMTGGAPQDTLDPKLSGKAINAIIKRQNLKTATIGNNAKLSIKWMGEVYQAIASDIYNSKRIMRVVGLDGSERQEMLFKEVVDTKTGKIIRANNLRDKKFQAYAGVGFAYQTMRDQTVEEIKGMIELLIKAGAAGEKYVPLLTNVMIENINGVGLNDLKKQVRIDMVKMGIRQPETDEEKAVAKQMAEAAAQPDPQKMLMEAAAAQQRGEAMKFESEARNLDSASVKNIATARKLAAETRKILRETGINRENVLKELLSTSLKRAERLPFPGEQTNQTGD